MTFSRSVLKGTCSVISARCARSTIVELRMVSEASFSFGITILDVVIGPEERVREVISSTIPSSPSKLTRSPSRSGCVTAIITPAMKFADRPLRGEADDDRDHGARGEERAGDAPHLRDDQQAREQRDEDDPDHQAAPQHAVARLGRRIEIAAA